MDGNYNNNSDNYRKKGFRDIFNLFHFIMMFPIAILEGVFIFRCLANFGVLRAAQLLLFTPLFVLNIFWMQAKFFEDRDLVRKRIKAWEKRRREARAYGGYFSEPKPVRTKIMTPPTLAVLFISLAVMGYGTLFFSIFNVPITKGRVTYNSQISALKAKEPADYVHFPDRVPEGTKDVKWIRSQGAFSSGCSDTLCFHISDRGYIDQTLDTYCQGIEPIQRYTNRNVKDVRDINGLVYYNIYNNGKFRRGIFVNENTGLIGFVVER